MTEIAEEILLRLWGKTNRDEKKKNSNVPEKYHPLLFHLIDVALCARMMWRMIVPIHVRQHIAEVLGLTDQEMEDVFVLLAGLHDIGKCYPNFQYKANALAEILRQHGISCSPFGKDIPHGIVSVPEIKRLFTSKAYAVFEVQPSVAHILGVLSGGHHGIFPTWNELDDLDDSKIGNAVWKKYRNRLAISLARLLLGDRRISLANCSSLAENPELAPLIAGLIAVADWFGSCYYFKIQCLPDKPIDIATYFRSAEIQAEIAIRRSGWLNQVKPGSTLTMQSLFSYVTAPREFLPNPIQQKAEEMISVKRAPYLMIIESTMGSGKTEIALFATDHGQSIGYSHGFYFGLPTMATSNSMYARIYDYLVARYTDGVTNLPLVHSHAFLDDKYRQRIEDGDFISSPVYDDERNGSQGQVVAYRWFAENKKQALLAQFGVGTIDQVLLGVVRTKHWFVRLGVGFGFGKVVVFDEIHAYDVYMSTILKRLISWLGQLGCTIVLLSATLSTDQRRQLLSEWCSEGSIDDSLSYPRITMADWQADTIQQETVPSTETVRTVELEFAANNAVAISERLKSALPDGGCAAIICNTVKHAQRLFEELEKELSDEGWECILFHARAPYIWRKKREDEILEKFGKQVRQEGKYTRPSKSVVIATQVLEQSLDIDFDYMLSEMAPIDLLLQRMGREHRHDANRYPRPHRPPVARFCVLIDRETEAGIPDFGISVQDDPEYSIYDRYIVLRSWLVLRDRKALSDGILKDRSSIVLPDDIQECVQKVYDQDDIPTSLSEEWKQALRTSKFKSDHKRDEDEKLASSVIIPRHDEFYEFWLDANTTLVEEEDPATHKSMKAATRLGQPSITMICFGTLADEDTETERLPSLEPLSGDLKTRHEQERNWMRFAISVQSKSLYFALLASPCENWKESSVLKHVRPVVFDKGIATIGSYQVQLTSKRGLEILNDTTSDCQDS